MREWWNRYTQRVCDPPPQGHVGSNPTSRIRCPGNWRQQGFATLKSRVQFPLGAPNNGTLLCIPAIQGEIGGDAGESNSRSSEGLLRIVLQAFPPSGFSFRRSAGGGVDGGTSRWVLDGRYRRQPAAPRLKVAPRRAPSGGERSAGRSRARPRERVRDRRRLLGGRLLTRFAANLGLLPGYVPSCRYLSSPRTTMRPLSHGSPLNGKGGGAQTEWRRARATWRPSSRSRSLRRLS